MNEALVRRPSVRKALAAACLVVVAAGSPSCSSEGDDSDATGDTSSVSAGESADESPSESSSVPSAGESAAGESNDEAPSESADPGDSSASAFCTAFADFQSSLSSVDPTAEPAVIITKLKEEAEKLGGVDTPLDIPADAESGFETVIDAISGVPDDATLEDLSGLETGFSTEDQANAEAFDTYLAATCPELGGSDASTDSGSDVPSPSPSAS